MIITSPVKLIPGKIYTEKEMGRPFEMYEQIYNKYRFFVLREATVEEFRWQIATMDYRNPEDISELNFFYDISMD